MLTIRSSCLDGMALGAPSGECARQLRPWVLTATILGSSMAFIDGSVVNVALPVIQAGLGATLGDMQWIVNGYTLLLGALILVGGSAGDRFGRRRVFEAGLIIFAAASALCGLAPDAPTLIAARMLQGIGAALLVPNSLAIISASFPEAERGRAIGTWAAFSAITAAVGPVLGGWLVDSVSWRAIFFVNLPIAAITLAISRTRVPESRNGSEGAAHIDWRGATLAALGLGGVTWALIAGVEQGAGPAVVGAAVGGLLALGLFLRSQAGNPGAMMPLPLFRSRTFNGANLTTLLLYFALSGVFFFLPFNLMRLQGYSATAAGLAFLPFMILVGTLSRVAGGLLDRFGARLPLVVGPLMTAVGFALLAVPGVGGDYWTTFFPGIVVIGIGMAVAVAPLTTTVMNAVDERHAGVASGVNNAISRTAGLLAVAVLGLVAFAAWSQSLDAALGDVAVPGGLAAPLELAREQMSPLLPDVETPAALGSALSSAFLGAFRLVMLVSAALAALAGIVAWAMIQPQRAAAS